MKSNYTLMLANVIHQNHTAVLQVSYREIFIFLNIPWTDFIYSIKSPVEIQSLYIQVYIVRYVNIL